MIDSDEESLYIAVVYISIVVVVFSRVLVVGRILDVGLVVLVWNLEGR